MSLITKIKNYPNMTEREQQLSTYIVAHSQEILHESTQTLGKKAHVSPATIVRFAKALGYTGYPEFKLALMADLTVNGKNSPAPVENLQQTDSLTQLIAKTQASDFATVRQTYQLLSEHQLGATIALIQRADKVALFGVGGSSIACADFSQKLLRAEKNVLYAADMQMGMSFYTQLTATDVAIFISNSGRTKDLLRVAKFLQGRHVPLVVITQALKSPLKKLADYALMMPEQKNNLRLGAVASRNAALMLTDLIYLGVIKDNLSAAKEKQNATNLLVKQFNQ